MKKTIIYALLLISFISSDAFAGDGKIFSYGPDGKNYFSLATDRILIGFNGYLSFEQKAAILGTERTIKPITIDDVMPAPAVTIANVNGLNEAELQALLRRLNSIRKLRSPIHSSFILMERIRAFRTASLYD